MMPNQSAPAVADPAPISLGEILPWALFALVLLSVAYTVTMGPGVVLHELLHDGRHLLAFPCH